MKRNEIVNSLLKEGFSESTLVKFSDKQLNDLAQRILGEADVMISNKDPQKQQKVVDAKKTNKSIEFYEEKPSSGLSKEKKSEIVKKAKKGEDIGKKGKGFEKIVKKSKESGAKDPEAVAAAAMWKNIKRENVEVKEWVKTLAENNFHSFTSKNEIMDLISTKITEQEVGSNVKKGHNGVPEFMSYDSISKSEVKEQSPTTKPKTKPTTKPSTPKPKTPYQPGPGKNPKPKALKETENANK
jgi:hypothetical protein